MKYRVYLTGTKTDWCEVEADDAEKAIEEAKREFVAAHGFGFEIECDEYEQCRE